MHSGQSTTPIIIMPKYTKNPNAKTEDEILDEEVEEFINPVETPEFEESLKWLKEILDEEIAERVNSWDEGHSNIAIPLKNEEMKQIWEKPAFKKYLTYNEFIAPNETQSSWCIPRNYTKSELKNVSDMLDLMINSPDIMKSKNIDIMVCKNCGNEFVLLLSHAKKSTICGPSYSAQDLEDLKAAHKLFSKSLKQDWYKANKNRLAKKKAEHYRENREAILQRMKTNSKLRRKSGKKNK